MLRDSIVVNRRHAPRSVTVKLIALSIPQFEFTAIGKKFSGAGHCTFENSLQWALSFKGYVSPVRTGILIQPISNVISNVSYFLRMRCVQRIQKSFPNTVDAMLLQGLFIPRL